MITTSAFLAFLAFVPFEIDPIVELPTDLELCIAKAELCLASGCWPGNCISEYEDCSYPIDEAHEHSCQMQQIWCELEADVLPDEWLKNCAMVAEVCGGDTCDWYDF